MNLTISGSDNLIYQNGSSETHQLTIFVSGQANVEVKTERRAEVSQIGIAAGGGAVSVQVPAAHRVEIDVTARTPINVQFLGIK